VRRRKAIEQLALGDEHSRSGVLEDQRPTLLRVGKVEGTYARRPSGFQNPDDHVQGAFRVERDEYLRADAGRPKSVREAARSPIELAVRQRLGSADCGHLAGARGGDPFEEGVQARVVGELHPPRIDASISTRRSSSGMSGSTPIRASGFSTIPSSRTRNRASIRSAVESSKRSVLYSRRRAILLALSEAEREIEFAVPESISSEPT